MSKRIAIDLTDSATVEVERMKQEMGLSTADVFRHALTMLRIYNKAVAGGDDVCLVKNGVVVARVELPKRPKEGKR